MQHTVEDCLPLDANRLAEGGWFGDGQQGQYCLD
jgi:hypothetical protein